MKKILSLFLSALIALTPIQQAQAQYLAPIVNTPYDQAVHNIPVVAHYTFGSTAAAPTDCAPGGSCVALTNVTALATKFDPLNVNATTAKINSEMQTYATDFTSGNHVFQSDNLQLTGTLDAGGNTNAIVYGNLGNNPGITVSSFPASAIGLSDVSMLAPGQTFIFTYLGQYAIASVTGTGGSATISLTRLLGSPATIGAGFFTPWAVMPSYYAAANAPTAAGNNVLHFAAVPAGVANGQAVAFYNNASNGSFQANGMNALQGYFVTAHDSTSVTLDKNLIGSDAVISTQGVFFTPPIRSGQIWSKNQYYMPGWHGVTYFAMKLKCKLPYGLKYGASGSLAGADSLGQYGGWPAWWMFGGSAAPSGPDNPDASEIDVMEEYNSITRDTHNIDPNIHQGASATLPAAVTDFLYKPSSWSLAGTLYTYNSTVDYSQGYHDLALLVTPDATYFFIDNLMVKKTNYHWTSTRPATLAANLAIGSFAAGLGTNMLMPIANTNFPQTYNLKEMEIRFK